MATQVKNMADGLALKEARKILKACTFGTGVVWKKRIRYEWMTGLKRPVLVELLSNGDLRVTDTKTRQLITQGPAWVSGDLTGPAN